MGESKRVTPRLFFPYCWTGQEDGQSLVELALVLPLLLLLMLGALDLGLGFRTYIGLSNAAREGVRYVTIYPDNPAGAASRAYAEAASVGLYPLSDIVIGGDGGVVVTLNPAKSKYEVGEKVTVHVEHDRELLFGAVTGLPLLPIRAQATMTVLYEEE